MWESYYYPEVQSHGVCGFLDLGYLIALNSFAIHFFTANNLLKDVTFRWYRPVGLCRGLGGSWATNTSETT